MNAKQKTKIAAVIELAAAHGFHKTETGGGCTALERLQEDLGLEILITVANDAAMPARIEEAVLVGLYAFGSSRQLAEFTAPSLSAALLALKHGGWEKPSDSRQRGTVSPLALALQSISGMCADQYDDAQKQIGRIQDVADEALRAIRRPA